MLSSLIRVMLLPTVKAASRNPFNALLVLLVLTGVDNGFSQEVDDRTAWESPYLTIQQLANVRFSENVSLWTMSPRGGGSFLLVEAGRDATKIALTDPAGQFRLTIYPHRVFFSSPTNSDLLPKSIFGGLWYREKKPLAVADRSWNPKGRQQVVGHVVIDNAIGSKELQENLESKGSIKEISIRDTAGQAIVLALSELPAAEASQALGDLAVANARRWVTKTLGRGDVIGGGDRLYSRDGDAENLLITILPPEWQALYDQVRGKAAEKRRLAAICEKGPKAAEMLLGEIGASRQHPKFSAISKRPALDDSIELTDTVSETIASNVGGRLTKRALLVASGTHALLNAIDDAVAKNDATAAVVAVVMMEEDDKNVLRYLVTQTIFGRIKANKSGLKYIDMVEKGMQLANEGPSLAKQLRIEADQIGKDMISQQLRTLASRGGSTEPSQ